jgi:hypothetical protein
MYPRTVQEEKSSQTVLNSKLQRRSERDITQARRSTKQNKKNYMLDTILPGAVETTGAFYKNSLHATINCGTHTPSGGGITKAGKSQTWEDSDISREMEVNQTKRKTYKSKIPTRKP